MHGVREHVEIIVNEQGAPVSADIQDIGIGEVIARGSGGEDVGAEHHPAQPVGSCAPAIFE